jgi:capsular polysaccharide transport system permease protein
MRMTKKKKGWRLAVLMVALPFLIAVVYFCFFSMDRYVSSSQVVVRQQGDNSGAQMPGLTMLIGSSNPSSREETLYLREYIVSMDMMLLLEEKLHWIEHYAAQRNDPVYWLSKNAPREELLEYYQRMVTSHYDDITGLLKVDVQAFDPDMSNKMLKEILSASERFVNEVSHSIAREQMKFALAELDTAKNLYGKRKNETLQFQNDNKVLDGTINAEGRAEFISKIEEQFSEQQAALTQMLYSLRADSPQVKQQKLKVSALREQMLSERKQLLSSPDGGQLNVVASKYQQLKLDTTIAEENYKAAVGAVEGARIEASKKLKTLVTVVSPNMPEIAIYPRRLYDLLTIFLALLMIYGITRFLIASIEDHRD